MIKYCVICGAKFSTPPSNNKSTCSSSCSKKWRSKQHMGISNRWGAAARAKAQANARALAERTEGYKKALAVARNMPEGQRGPQNREAKIWHLRDPDGNPVIAVNLMDWARHHTEDFGMEPTEKSAFNIASGFRQIKRSMEGKIRRNGKVCTVSSYKGWTLVAWEEKKK